MSNDDRTLALKSLQCFSALSAETLAPLAPFTSIRIVRAGETIFCQGEPSPYCFGVLSGEVAIQRVSKDRRFPPKILAMAGAGALFGESAIFEDSPRAAMASAAKDGQLLAIRGSELREWSKKNPEAGQRLLLTLLQSAQKRLFQTSHELAVVYGIARLLGSSKPIQDQLESTIEFLRSSLDGLDDLVFYQRNAYWEEFNALISLPGLTDLPAVTLKSALVQKVNEAGAVQVFDPKQVLHELAEIKLPWESRAAIAIIPLFDWDKAKDPLQGLLFLATASHPEIFLPEKQLLLTSVAQPLAEALSRHSRHQDALAQARLEQSKKSFPR
jgi:CRP-like cAMP-binding protein